MAMRSGDASIRDQAFHHQLGQCPAASGPSHSLAADGAELMPQVGVGEQDVQATLQGFC